MKTCINIFILLSLFSCRENQLIKLKYVKGDIGREYVEVFYDSSKIVGDFAVNKEPITNNDYLLFLRKNMAQATQNWKYWLNTDTSLIKLYGNEFRIIKLDKKKSPVLGIQHAGKIAYCKWLNNNKAVFFKEKYDKKYGDFRIPSQIELQYARRNNSNNYFWIVITYLGPEPQVEF